MSDVLILAATRKSRSQFERSSYLGSSLRRLNDGRIKSAIAYKNARGLPSVFNRHIAEKNRNRILVFTHDDVWIDDYWLSDRLNEGLQRFDVIGVAGNRRRAPNQSVWAFTPEMRWDAKNLSGVVCHVHVDGEAVSWYGTSGQRCKLLDGVLIAVSAATLLDRQLRFDNQFAFHFYDLDFCRTAEEHGLKLGTWPIALTHASGGSFGSPAWKRALKLYRAKWPD